MKRETIEKAVRAGLNRARKNGGDEVESIMTAIEFAIEMGLDEQTGTPVPPKSQDRGLEIATSVLEEGASDAADPMLQDTAFTPAATGVVQLAKISDIKGTLSTLRPISSLRTKRQARWDQETLVKFLEANAPTTIRIIPRGKEEEGLRVPLARNIQYLPLYGSADDMQNSGGVKLTYKYASASDDLIVGHTFVITKNLDVDLDAVMRDIHERAVEVYRVRPSSLENRSPAPTGSLSDLMRGAANAGRADEKPDTPQDQDAWNRAIRSGNAESMMQRMIAGARQ